MAEPSGPHLRIAEAIADGIPVEWERELAAPGVESSTAHALRLIERIGAAHDAKSDLPETIAGKRTVPLPGPRSWGPLRLIAKLGEGAFGEVHRAFDPALEREVALKLRRPGTSLDDERFLREGRRLARIRHPNVLVVHGADRHDGRAGLWTDLLAGRTLTEWVEDHGVLSAEEAARIGVDISRALAAVHAAGLIHCDVKGSNVMRETGGRIVLMDFGCASASPALSDLTADDFAGGTPQFMAPEQIRGTPPSPLFDIHATGVLLYWLVSKRYPVEARTLPELIAKIERGERTPLRDARADLPGAFVQVVERAIAPRPADRFPSAGALEAALLSTLGLAAAGSAPADVVAATIPREERPRRRRALLAAGLALAAVVALGAFATPRFLDEREFTLEASFFRAGAEEARLRPGGRVAVGDQLFLEATPSRDLYLYILNEDEAGRTAVLFPREGALLSNPLPGGRTHRLPGEFSRPDGPVLRNWRVDSVGGTEHFLIVASLEPLPALEREVERMELANRSGETGSESLSAQASAGLRSLPPRTRGVGGTIDATPPAGGAAAQKLSSIVADLPEEAARSSDGVLVRRFQLANPPP